MPKIIRGIGALVLLIGAGLFAAWATSPDPKGNPASFEGEKLIPRLASPDEAWTLAQAFADDEGEKLATLLVIGFTDRDVEAVDLSRFTGSRSSDPFAVLQAVDEDTLAELFASGPRVRYAYEDIRPAAPNGERHVATGTNFPEHAEEASSDAVFQFPKFGGASPARTRVEWRDDVLLDYEVELCMRFDRPVSTIEDFDAAVKGLFLCGDFTDRATLIRLIDPDNLDSGNGFSDGKSRVDFYPSGPFLVIPRDWRSFVAEERMMTFVNDEPRQDARGKEMTLDFRGLTEKALGDMEKPRFLFQGQRYRLTPDPRITPAMTLMSGTAEGVIFTPPSRADIIEGGLSYLFTGGWLSGQGPVAHIIDVFVENELDSDHYLMSGDVVEFNSSRLGNILIDVTPSRVAPSR